MVGISPTIANERISYPGAVFCFVSETYPQSHLIAMAFSIRWAQTAILQQNGSEHNEIRNKVRKQEERLDYKTFSHLTKVDGCGNVGVVLS